VRSRVLIRRTDGRTGVRARKECWFDFFQLDSNFISFILRDAAGTTMDDGRRDDGDDDVFDDGRRRRRGIVVGDAGGPGKVCEEMDG